MNDSKTTFVNINSLLPLTLAEGPGRRFCIWLQGCLRKCRGCCNPQMQPLEPHLVLPANEVCQMIQQAKNDHDIEGVTFLGGEPLLQARGISVIAAFCHSIGLNVIVFTGFLLKECREENMPGIEELLSNTDLLIDGPFDADSIDEQRNWVGSTNQVFHYLSDAFEPSIETDPKYRGLIEVRVQGNALWGNGCPKSMAAIPVPDSIIKNVTSQQTLDSNIHRG